MKENTKRIFLKLKNSDVSYGFAYEKILSIKEMLLKSGVKSRDRVILLCNNNNESIVLGFLSILFLDGVCCISRPEIISENHKLNAKWLISVGDFESVEYLKISEDHGVCLFKKIYYEKFFNTPLNTILIAPTSGTTSLVKWVVLSHGSLLYNISAIKEYMNVQLSDTLYMIKNISHISTLTSDVLLSVISGASLVVSNEVFSPQNINYTVHTKKVTKITIVPTILQLMLRYNVELLKSLDTISIVGAPIKVDLLQTAIERLPGSKILCGYGLTEASSRVTFLPYQDLSAKLGSIGKPIEGTNIRLIKDGLEVNDSNEVGEIVISGSGVMTGYLKDGEIEYIHELFTKDLGYRDKDGFYYHVGRNDELIILNGKNISYLYIEEAIESLVEVDSAHVFKKERSGIGEYLVAILVMKKDNEITSKGIYSILKTILPSYMLPKRLYLTNESPCSVLGKISRRALESWVEEKGGEDIEGIGNHTSF
ncbi:class I adenylate-forming enzyme family protein [Paenibacillus odorifer]|uniref:class I adenylate-forming enzyme family protein n=2 Tax=Paenibacillus TaxID=44249 RepID=UPI00158E0088|nr:class I adenylate-forming enzyme family protein [Paenibacillus odorifer]